MNKTVHISISPGILGKIDQAAKARSLTRSGWISSAAVSAFVTADETKQINSLYAFADDEDAPTEIEGFPRLDTEQRIRELVRSLKQKALVDANLAGATISAGQNQFDSINATLDRMGAPTIRPGGSDVLSTASRLIYVEAADADAKELIRLLDQYGAPESDEHGRLTPASRLRRLLGDWPMRNAQAIANGDVPPIPRGAKVVAALLIVVALAALFWPH